MQEGGQSLGLQNVAEPFVVVLYGEGMSGEQIKEECGMRDSVVRVRTLKNIIIRGDVVHV